jgi:hypothetical protein
VVIIQKLLEHSSSMSRIRKTPLFPTWTNIVAVSTDFKIHEQLNDAIRLLRWILCLVTDCMWDESRLGVNLYLYTAIYRSAWYQSAKWRGKNQKVKPHSWMAMSSTQSTLPKIHHALKSTLNSCSLIFLTAKMFQQVDA